MMASKVSYGKTASAASTATNTTSSNNNSNVVLKTIKVNLEKASTARTVGYDFLNPSEDFVGIVECISDIRHIAKKGEMKQDIDVVDVIVIEAVETREREEIINGRRQRLRSKFTMRTSITVWCLQRQYFSASSRHCKSSIRH
jgi:uncharacterized protein (DUF849 family)